MSLPSRLGSYPIERELGRGGMGIVYLALDPRLGRAVAIKVLPETVAKDPERLSRFDREARVLASLNHPNIAGIYGIEESDGHKFLVLEYVEGETLAERLARGPLPFEEGLEIGRQIASALESAHENGIVHRDLKPANVKLTSAGDVKVLDFGLAKAMTGPGDSDFELTRSPTRPLVSTETGMILGTAAYMSPEQARGKSLDRRTDIWSFGCVLFECLTGRRAFGGDSVSDLIVVILQADPDWSRLPSRVPTTIRMLLSRCLEKDSRKRLRDIGDARIEIEHAIAIKDSGPMGTPLRLRRRVSWAWGAAGLFAASTIALALLHPGSKSSRLPLMRLSVVSPIRIGDRDAVRAALSPDGTQLAFAGEDSSGDRGLWLRRLDSPTLERLTGSEDAVSPFWSPDGTHIGFFTSPKLKTMNVRTKAVDTLCPVTSFGRGGTWNRNGVILFAPAGEGPLMRVSASGGPVEQVTVLDSTLHETAHRYPCFLPDGRHFLYVALPPDANGLNVFVGDLETKGKTLLMKTWGAPVYVDPGYLLYVRNGRMVAQRFDAAKRRLVGEGVILEDPPSYTNWTGAPCFSASQQGSLCLVTPPSPNKRLVWFDRSGHPLGTIPIPEDNYESISLSPDDRRAAMVKRTSIAESEIWLVDLERGIAERFTNSPGEVENPVWSRDGTRIAFASTRNGPGDIYVKAANGATPETPVYRSKVLFKAPEDWSPDGKYLLFHQLSEKTAYDLWVQPLDGSPAFPYLTTPFDERDATFSPDGKWVLYWSSESGKNDVFVRSFPNPDHKIQISTNGGIAGMWSADGRHILFTAFPSLALNGIGGGKCMIVDVLPGEPFRVGTPREVFRIREQIAGGDADAGLDRVLALVESGNMAPNSFSITLNWPAALAQ